MLQPNKIFQLFTLLLFAWVLQACTAANPIAQAETVDQKAYAAYGTYVIFAEKAADIAERPDVSTSVKLKLIQAEEKASPVAKNLLDTVLEYEEIRDEVAAGTNTSEKLLIVSNQLNNWVTQLAPLINELIRNVKGAD